MAVRKLTRLPQRSMTLSRSLLASGPLSSMRVNLRTPTYSPSFKLFTSGVLIPMYCITTKMIWIFLDVLRGAVTLRLVCARKTSIGIVDCFLSKPSLAQSKHVYTVALGRCSHQKCTIHLVVPQGTSCPDRHQHKRQACQCTNSM